MSSAVDTNQPLPPPVNNTIEQPTTNTQPRSRNITQPRSAADREELNKERTERTDATAGSSFGRTFIKDYCGGCDPWFIGQLAIAILAIAVGGATLVTALTAKKIAIVSYLSLAPKYLACTKLTAAIGAVIVGAGAYLLNSLRAAKDD